MLQRSAGLIVLLLLLALAPAAAAPGAADAAPVDGRALYGKLCAGCHGKSRYGGYAPPLIPETLKRKDAAALAGIIREGLPQTQMPPFGEALKPAQVAALVAHLHEPVGEIAWNAADILASRVVPPVEPSGYEPPEHRENLILVVERGTGSIAVLDGDTLRELDRYPVGRIHGGPKFDDAYTRVTASTRDGTLVAYDLLRGRIDVKAKVAVNTRNIAVSGDGQWVAAANQLPRNLVILDGALRPLKVFPLAGKPSGVYRLPGRNAFVLTLRDVPRLITVSYPELSLRQVELPLPFEDFTFVPGRPQVLASSRGGKQILLYDLERERILHTLATTGLPHLFSVTYFRREGALLAALNHIGVPRLSIVNLETFELEKAFTLAGAGYFVRTHPGSPYLWADTNTDRVQLVDKASLTLLERPLIPEPGKKAMHVEFTADGRLALLSLWHPQGAVVVYDSATLAELTRLPFRMPVGKYNARNKTHPPPP